MTINKILNKLNINSNINFIDVSKMNYEEIENNVYPLISKNVNNIRFIINYNVTFIDKLILFLYNREKDEQLNILAIESLINKIDQRLYLKYNTIKFLTKINIFNIEDLFNLGYNFKNDNNIELLKLCLRHKPEQTHLYINDLNYETIINYLIDNSIDIIHVPYKYLHVQIVTKYIVKTGDISIINALQKHLMHERFSSKKYTFVSKLIQFSPNTIFCYDDYFLTKSFWQELIYNLSYVDINYILKNINKFSNKRIIENFYYGFLQNDSKFIKSINVENITYPFLIEIYQDNLIEEEYMDDYKNLVQLFLKNNYE